MGASFVSSTALNDAPQIFSFEIEDKDHAYAGGSVNLTCLAAAKSGIIQFRKHGEELIEDGQRLFYRQLHDLPNRNYVKAALEIRNVSFGDAVNYTCVAVDARRNIVRKRFRLVVGQWSSGICVWYITDWERQRDGPAGECHWIVPEPCS